MVEHRLQGALFPSTTLELERLGSFFSCACLSLCFLTKSGWDFEWFYWNVSSVNWQILRAKFGFILASESPAHFNCASRSVSSVKWNHDVKFSWCHTSDEVSWPSVVRPLPLMTENVSSGLSYVNLPHPDSSWGPDSAISSQITGTPALACGGSAYVRTYSCFLGTRSGWASYPPSAFNQTDFPAGLSSTDETVAPRYSQDNVLNRLLFFFFFPNDWGLVGQISGLV